MMRILRPALGLCALSFLSAGLIHADLVEFTGKNLGTGGTIDWSTVTGPATVTNAYIRLVTSPTVPGGILTGGLCSAVNGAVTTTDLACLNITTGAFQSATPVGNIVTILYSGSGSSLFITGSAAVFGLSSPTGTLWSGSFDSSSTVQLQYNTLTKSGTLSGLLNDGALNGLLANALGVPSKTVGDSDTQNEISIALSGNTGQGAVSSSTVDLETVPDGGMTLMLLGVILVGVEGLRRRLHI